MLAVVSMGGEQADAAAISTPAVLDPATILLGDQDLPAGFQRYAPLTGPLDYERQRAMGIDSTLPSGQGYVRSWIDPSSGQSVAVLVVDCGRRDNAEAVVNYVRASTRRVYGSTEFAVPRVAAYGFMFTRRINDIDAIYHRVIFRRGPLIYKIETIASIENGAANKRLAVDLAARQWAMAPAELPDVGLDYSDKYSLASELSGRIFGWLLLYLTVVAGFAHLNDPLRHHIRVKSSDRISTAIRYSPGVIVDVTADSRRRRYQATARLVVRLVGVAVAVPVASPIWWPQSFVVLPIVLLLCWLPLRFIPVAHPAPSVARRILTSRHPLSVVLLFAMATMFILAGVVSLVVAASSVGPPRVIADAASGYDQIPTPTQLYLFIGISLLVIGLLCYDGAQLLGRRAAHELIRRDRRRLVLFLRSFHDDMLRLRTTTVGRQSLIQALSPRRYDLFEEVLVRHLSAVGPVVALNPHGATTKPIGAARETVPADVWQHVIADWMQQSALIVIVCPPQHVTSGLVWELGMVNQHRLWSKTIIVTPPVHDQAMRLRWQVFTHALAGLWPFTVPLPSDPTDVLTLSACHAGSHAGWTVVTAGERTEWTYASALTESLRWVFEKR